MLLSDGGMVVHHPYIAHGFQSNRSYLSRRVLVFSFAPTLTQETP